MICLVTAFNLLIAIFYTLLLIPIAKTKKQLLFVFFLELFWICLLLINYAKDTLEYWL